MENVHEQTSNIWNQYVQACVDGNLQLLDYLISNNIIDVNQVDDRQRSGLHFAVVKNRLQVVEYLLSKGADTTLKDVNNNTSLHLASVNGFSSIVQAILNNNIGSGVNDNILSKDVNNNTPLQLASSRLKRMFENIKSSSSSSSNNSQLYMNRLENELKTIIQSIIEYVNLIGNDHDKLKMEKIIKNFNIISNNNNQDDSNNNNMNIDDNNNNSITNTINDLEDLLGNLSII